MNNNPNPDSNNSTPVNNADLRDGCIWLLLSGLFFIAAYFYFDIVMAVMRFLFYAVSALLLWGAISALSEYISMVITKIKNK